MSTVRVYKSTDPGAPPHPSALRGSMAALLRACLVVGYGSGEDAKVPAGWEEPFVESGNYAVFRATQGTARMFYQIDDNQPDADVTIMTMFDSMSDAASGSGDRGSVYFGKYDPGYSTKWMVIADEKTAYFWSSCQYDGLLHGFGEYTSLIKDDPCPAFISGHWTSTEQMVSTNDTGSPLARGYSTNSNVVRSGYLRRSISSPEKTSFYAISMNNSPGYPVGGRRGSELKYENIDGVDIVVFPMLVAATNDYEIASQPCGIMRGLYIALYRVKNEYINSPEGFFIGPKLMLCYLVLGGGSGTDGQVIFDASGDWD